MRVYDEHVLNLSYVGVYIEFETKARIHAYTLHPQKPHFKRIAYNYAVDDYPLSLLPESRRNLVRLDRPSVGCNFDRICIIPPGRAYVSHRGGAYIYTRVVGEGGVGCAVSVCLFSQVGMCYAYDKRCRTHLIVAPPPPPPSEHPSPAYKCVNIMR